jgi:cell division protein FtsL
MNTKKSSNPIKSASVIMWTFIALLLGAVGFQIVHLKNQQFQLGQKIRGVEQAIRETRVVNQVLLADIATLSSRAVIQKKLASQTIVMVSIQDQFIARLATPEDSNDGDVLRTASNERFRQ